MKRSEGILFVIQTLDTRSLNIIINCQMSVIEKKNKPRTKSRRSKVSTNIKKLCQTNKPKIVDQRGHGLHG
jgi:hypothetical protein